MTKKEIAKVIISVLIAALTALAAGLGLTSCNVTRTITTRSEAWQKGDTSVIIQSKTVESYERATTGVGSKPPRSLKLFITKNAQPAYAS